MTSAPLSIIDPRYRGWVATLLEAYRQAGRRLVSVGAGNGLVEARLQAAAWDVTATDPAASALRLCESKGLRTAEFRLLADPPPGQFDVVYCDGVMGHLWEPDRRAASAWSALAQLAHTGAICLVSNDLSDDDDEPDFAVRGDPAAAFYRPPSGWHACDASSTGRWSIEAEHHYAYERSGRPRRREVVIARAVT